MQLRICATVAWSCSPNTLSGLFWNWGACGFSVAIVFAASAASRAKCSLRAASRNVHQAGIDRWPSRSTLLSGSRPASRAISRARSWYGSDRSMPCTWLLPPADATLRARRFRNEPVGHGVLLIVVAPLASFSYCRGRSTAGSSHYRNAPEWRIFRPVVAKNSIQSDSRGQAESQVVQELGCQGRRSVPGGCFAHTVSTVEPTVLRDSRSRCACAASFSG